MKNKIIFKDYYQMYLAAHKHPATKILHFLGQFLTIGYIWLIVWLTLRVSYFWVGYLYFAPNIIYLLAWPSHWWIEKNEPLAYTNKWYAKLSDLKMFLDVFTGKVPLDAR